MNRQTVIGVFDTNNQAKSAEQALIEAEFDKTYIDVSSYGENGSYSTSRKGEDDSRLENFFENLFGSEDSNASVARSREVASRGTVVTVQVDGMDRAKRAAAILDRYGAIDFDERYNQYQNGTFDADRNYTELNERFGDVSGKIEVIQEDIAVGKREVETGGIVVRSRIIQKPVKETLRLREEEVYINRETVNRPATEADFREGTISVTETAEEAVVAKDARVVEEITVGKDVDTRSETIKETVRETEVDVDRVDGKTVREYESAK